MNDELSDDTAARILHIERQEHKRALRAAFLRGARAMREAAIAALLSGAYDPNTKRTVCRWCY